MGSAVFAATSGPFVTSTPIPFTLTDWTGTLAFQKFNSALGTLTGVDIAITGNMQTVLTVTNTSPSGSTGTAKTELQMSLVDPGGYMSGDNPLLDFFSPNYSFNLGPNQSVTSGTLTKSASATWSSTAGNVLSEFTGPGNIVLNGSTYTQTWVAYNGGNAAATQVTQGSLTGNITYYYNPVQTPEPSGLVLLGSALAGLVTLVKRRR